MILIVDTDDETRRGLARFLENSGYGVAVAEGGVTAMIQLSVIHPDIIIIDSERPDMDGFEVSATIGRKFPERMHSIIMMVPQGCTVSVDRMFASGAEEYVTKPVHLIALGRLIKRKLEYQAMVLAMRLHQPNKEPLPATWNGSRELDRINMALNESEDKFKCLVDSSPDTIVILDQVGFVHFINHPPPGQSENLMEKRLLDILPEQSKPRFLRAMHGTFTRLQTESFQIGGPDGTWWHVRTAPMKQHENISLPWAMVIVSDRTQQHNTETKAMRNARLATIGALVANVAHEVNNPNNAILLQASWLKKTWQNILVQVSENEKIYDPIMLDGETLREILEKSSGFLADIVGNSRRIGSIVRDMKRVTRPDDGILRNDVCIKKVLDSALSILANPIHKHTQSCFAEADPNLPRVIGNPHQLEQVFINLILNALQSLPDRTRKVRIRAWFDETIRKIAVVVEDEGEGITEENLEKICFPFFTTKLAKGGTGLGLAICRSILTRHKSSMDINSESGRGTSIRINLTISPNQPESAP
ncbi:MAG: response regulator [Magnetococcales bacterium]|nr:response regulator [Magnetococcales bacterium]MBF0148954.1 response regulator [Magnetococcales bacterium]MBF0173827.1 response regulator [Magnetococcales bacterium]MBF0631176.1 response regulator [Magnetococcales bacterium]